MNNSETNPPKNNVLLNEDDLTPIYEEVEEEDFEVKKDYTTNVIFVISILALINSIIIAWVGKPIPIFLICLYVIFITPTLVLCFKRLDKKSNNYNKLKIIRNLITIFAFLSLLITFYSVALWLFEIMNI